MSTPSLHNNSKRRRFRRDLAKALIGVQKSGTPNPWGNREYRRSKRGKAEILLRLQKETLALREMLTGALEYEGEKKNAVDGQVSTSS